jgi:hypothetical protein
MSPLPAIIIKRPTDEALARRLHFLYSLGFLWKDNPPGPTVAKLYFMKNRVTIGYLRTRITIIIQRKAPCGKKRPGQLIFPMPAAVS